jgi:hypothetical protein
MRRSWFVLLGSTLTALILAAWPLVQPAAAKPREPEDERGVQPARPPEWSEPVVRGDIIGTHWAEGKDPKQKTATIVIWSKESNLAVNVYGDDPRVREVIVNGTACVGRYAIVGGDRQEETVMIGQSIEVQNLNLPCTATIQPVQNTQAQPATKPPAQPVQQSQSTQEPPAAASALTDLPFTLPPLQEPSEGQP